MDVFGLVDTNNTCEGLSSFVVMEIRGVLLFELGFWLDSREFTASAFSTASMGHPCTRDRFWAYYLQNSDCEYYYGAR